MHAGKVTNMQGLCEWRKVYTELSPCYFIGNFKAKQSMSFIHDSSSRNSCFHSTFSKTGNKYVLLSYFHALKNPTSVSIVQFVFWGLCSITQPALFQSIMDFCSLNVKVKSHNDSLSRFFSPTPVQNVSQPHIEPAGWEDVDKISPGTEGNLVGSGAPSQLW